MHKLDIHKVTKSQNLMTEDILVTHKFYHISPIVYDLDKHEE